MCIRDSVKDILNQLFEKEIQSVLIEGGAKTLQPFIDADLYDEARIFRTNEKLKEGLVAPKFNQNLISYFKKIKNDKLLIVYRDWITSNKDFGHLTGLLICWFKNAKIVCPFAISFSDSLKIM